MPYVDIVYVFRGQIGIFKHQEVKYPEWKKDILKHDNVQWPLHQSNI